MSPPCDLRVSGGFVLLTAWFGLVNGWRMLAAVLSAALVHELGHWLVLTLLGAPVRKVRLGVFGAVMDVESGGLSYGGELAAVLAGPAANLVAAALLTARGGPAGMIGAHVVLCGFNLLPIRPLDGGRALELAVTWLAGPQAGETAARWTGTAAAAVLAAGIAWVMWRSGGTLWLLPALGGCLYWGARPWGEAA